MIDLHSHILPGLDDGARDLGESLAIARAAVADGIARMCVTPHVRDDYPTTCDEMETAFARLRFELFSAGIPLTLAPGAEVAIDRLPQLEVAQMRRLTLGATGVYMLLETPYTVYPRGLPVLVEGLAERGITPLMAHPERCRELQRRPDLIRAAVERGALVQVTAGSLAGRFGPASQSAADYLLANDLAHVIASDCHRPDGRSFISQAARRVDDPDRFRWMTTSASSAILAGCAPPDRPAARRRNWAGKPVGG